MTLPILSCVFMFVSVSVCRNTLLSARNTVMPPRTGDEGTRMCGARSGLCLSFFLFISLNSHIEHSKQEKEGRRGETATAWIRSGK